MIAKLGLGDPASSARDLIVVSIFILLALDHVRIGIRIPQQFAEVLYLCELAIEIGKPSTTEVPI